MLHSYIIYAQQYDVDNSCQPCSDFVSVLVHCSCHEYLLLTNVVILLKVLVFFVIVRIIIIIICTN